MIKNKLILLAVAMLITVCAFAQKGKKEKLLDGMTFNITLTTESTAKPTKPISDQLTFKGDKIKSKVMSDKYNFKQGTFTATVDSSDAEEIVITFDAVMKGEGADEILTWHGTVTDEDIEGNAIWTKKGKTKKSFAIVGLLQKKKK
ncbi:MAG: hypothetical protein IT238_04030 [Bacteroidia bacterium]|nr:hypothetical protein [Bacteroidia bacterium]MCZ2247240.1 hypothetical protein [Bacteroidia bacterium]